MSLLKWISLWVCNMYEHEGQVMAVCSWPTGNCTLRTITWTLLHNKLDNLWLRGGGGWGQYSRVSSLQACCLLKDLASWLKLASTEVNLSSFPVQISSVQLLSHVQLFVSPLTAACQDSLSITNFWSLLKLMSIELVMSTISSSVVPFSSRLQSYPPLGSFPMSQFFTSGSQRIGVSTSASVLPVNIPDWFP